MQNYIKHLLNDIANTTENISWSFSVKAEVG